MDILVLNEAAWVAAAGGLTKKTNNLKNKNNQKKIKQIRKEYILSMTLQNTPVT